VAHTVGKDVYRSLGRKIDGLAIRAPWNERLHAILKELYSPAEADVVARMPYGLSDFERVQEVTRHEPSELRRILDSACAKGLVMDLWVQDRYYYAPSPVLVGLFEFTMMRTGGTLNTGVWSRLFHDYLFGDRSFGDSNFGKDTTVSFARTLPYEDAVLESEHTKVLDYESATALVKEADMCAIGVCSCRHEKLHLGEKECDVPLDTCSSFGVAADYMVSHNFARAVTQSEMLENIVRSKELGLVLNADNVQKRITFICHCCKCCCNALLGIRQGGWTNTIVTSNYIAQIDEDICEACGACAEACAIDAITMVPAEDPTSEKAATPQIDTSLCLGCGVCGRSCPTGAARLVAREARVIHPETTFKRVILQCLERGTLQNQLFDNPQSVTQKFLRGFIGGLLRLSPVKRALMSDTLRSSFLSAMNKGVQKQGKGWLAEI
jgi:NAD-dependent dihydropyrimidine dehydrogenase PreA subunit